MIELANKMNIPGALLAPIFNPKIVVSIMDSNAPMVGPATKPSTAHVDRVAVNSTFFDGSTAAEIYACSIACWPPVHAP